MKQTFLAIAVMGAFAGSAMAADVTLYGLVDYGFNYQHRDLNNLDLEAKDSFEMRSGMNSGSRFGLKGTEDLGNGLKVGFVLENGFNADDGTLGNGGRLFGRESQVYLQGNFGTLSFGRVGQFASANGSYGLLGKASPFSGGWGDSVGAKFVFATGYERMDNTITYVTPEFAGFKVHAQYSFKNDVKNDVGDEGKSNANRYYALAATYETQNLYLVGIVDSINFGDFENAYIGDGNPEDDSLTVTLGGNYDFGVAKLYALGQYFKNVNGIGQKAIDGSNNWLAPGYTLDSATNTWEGYGLTMGVGVPAFGGTAKASIGYMDAESSEDVGDTFAKGEINRWNLSVGYDYSLSKRTSVYTAAAYQRDDVNYYENDASSIEFMAGMIHKF